MPISSTSPNGNTMPYITISYFVNFMLFSSLLINFLKNSLIVVLFKLVLTPVCVYRGFGNLPSAGGALARFTHHIYMVAALKSFDQPALSASAHRLPYAFDLPIQLSCRLSRLPALLPLPVFLRPVSEIVASIS